MAGRLTRFGAFARLRGGDPVIFASDLCLIVRRPGMDCGRCREARLAGALLGGQWSIALETEGCAGCGMCAATCPTGALMVEGRTAYAPDAAGERIALKCRRVAATERDANAVVVPCLGGFTTPDLLDLLEKTEATIVLADRGWCSVCPVGRCNGPWQPALDETRALLAAVNVQLANDLIAERDGLSDDAVQDIVVAHSGNRKGERLESVLRGPKVDHAYV